MAIDNGLRLSVLGVKNGEVGRVPSGRSPDHQIEVGEHAPGVRVLDLLENLDDRRLEDVQLIGDVCLVYECPLDAGLRVSREPQPHWSVPGPADVDFVFDAVAVGQDVLPRVQGAPALACFIG